ncbi:MAG TPA: protease modulator HflK [Stellaceae bacterium]|nr:protease modulator HflK [Stellaceae bacterium]
MSDSSADPAARFLQLSHFRSARRAWRITSIASSACLLGGVIAAVAAVILTSLADAANAVGLLGLCSGSLLLAACGLLSIAAISRARLLVLLVEHGSLEAQHAPAAESDAESAPPSPDRAEMAEVLARAVHRLERSAGWHQRLRVGSLAVLALAALVCFWPRPGTGATGNTDFVLAGIAIVAAFPMLVLERWFASLSEAELPEALALERLMCATLLGLFGGAAATIAVGIGFEWAIWIERAIALVLSVVALELLARAVAPVFLPPPRVEETLGIADSAVMGVILASLTSRRRVGATLRDRFGFDLSRSWALRFMRQAFPFVAFAMLLAAWGSSGLTALGLDERGIYERLGVPVEVLKPGLHLRLPWPLGIVRRVEYGAIHQLSVGYSAETAADTGRSLLPTAAVQGPDTAHAEDPAPEGADRLWDQAHPAEASFLIASESGGRQSFQLVDIDLRIIYRLRLGDDGAMAAAYRIEAPDAMVRSAAGRLLARYFADRTLLGVLGASREEMTAEIKSGLQSELDRLSRGIEVLAIVIDAIHPPPGAADSFHNVQAAEITAQTGIATERGRAAQNLNIARQESNRIEDDALARAVETVNAADIAEQRFSADHTAHAKTGKAFLLERWLGGLSRALSKAQLVIVDHRLDNAGAPTIDLRNPSLYIEPTP